MRFLLSTTNCRKALSFLAVLLLACAPAWAAGDPPKKGEPKDPKKLSRSARRWVDKTLKKMTLEERVGQLLMVPYFGEFSNTHSEEFQRFLLQIEKLHIGGYVVATRPRKPSGNDKTDVYGLARLTNRLQKAARVPLLVSADFERGAAFRVRGTTDFPYNMVVGAAGDTRYAYKMGAVAAREARAMGVHWVLAPVADVNNNPENPVINIRSFGEDPEAVAELVASFVKGVEENGALATAKHFPGHGDTAVNSHLDLPTIAGDRARLDAVELVPFRAAIKAGVSSVMPGHLLAPAIEPDENLAATFSKAMLTKLLRREMGFDGLIITDAMVMNAITKDFWAGEATVRAVEAGVDVVLMPPDAQVSYDALLRAVRSGRLSKKRLDESVRRILTAKARLNLHEESQVALSKAEEVVGSVGSHNVAQKIADAGITLLRNNNGLLPIDSTRPQRGLLVVLSATPSSFPGKTLAAELKPRVDSLQVVRTDPLYFPPEEIELPAPESYDWVLVAVYQQGSDDSNEIGLPDGMPELVEQAFAGDKPSALLVLGNPYLARHFPQVETVLLSYSSTASSDRAVIRALFGQTRIQGHLPVTLPGATGITATIGRGAGITRWESPMKLTGAAEEEAFRFAPVFELLDHAPAEGIAPGGVLAVGHKGRLTALRPFGRFRYDKKSDEVTKNTIYDLASLTKVVGTTTATMLLYERRVLPLDAPVVRFLPEFGRGPNPEARRVITVQDLLTHSSGLPSYVRYFLELDNHEEILERIYAIPLDYPTGTKSVYSDLGIILLGEIIERVSGQPLEEFLHEEIFSPLGMEKIRYNPPKSWREHIPPTEKDAEGRKGVIHGEVHDGNTWAMGGVAPHAGLFAPARELAVFCQFLLNGGIYAHKRILKRETIEFFTRRRNIPDSTRALGWDTPSPPPEYASGGKYISPSAFGHTGYTGTSIWIDPERELFVVLLTNRVHPTRENRQIREFRPLVHNAVMEALGLAGSPAAPPE